MAPSKVTSQNVPTVFENIHGKPKKDHQCHLQIGDRVHAKIEKKTFQKGYAQNWTTELFIIKKIRKTINNVCMYKVYRFDGKQDDRNSKYFYFEELNLALRPYTTSIITYFRMSKALVLSQKSHNYEFDKTSGQYIFHYPLINNYIKVKLDFQLISTFFTSDSHMVSLNILKEDSINENKNIGYINPKRYDLKH